MPKTAGGRGIPIYKAITTIKLESILQDKTKTINKSTRIHLRIDISLQKSSMFSAVRSCSKKTLIATSVPFHIPRKTSPKKPVIEVYKEHNKI